VSDASHSHPKVERTLVSSTDPHSDPAPVRAEAEAEAAEAVDDQLGESDTDPAVDESDDHLREAHALAAQLRTHAEQLRQLDEADLADHVEFYQSTHAQLQRALSDIDNA
jgi:hypothetical protein